MREELQTDVPERINDGPEMSLLLKFVLIAQLLNVIHTSTMQDRCMATEKRNIPVVDLSKVNVSMSDDEVLTDDARQAAVEIKDALIEWGFVYLKNHGIPMDQINKSFESSKAFFEKPLEVKEKYERQAPSTKKIFGYSSMGRELFNNKGCSPVDVKECFDYAVEPSVLWPSEVPNFQMDVEKMYQYMARLALRILHLFGIALNLDDPFYFCEKHSKILDGGTGTSFRTLYYPPITQNKVSPGQMRISEHTDYGSMTLLFQDDIGGLSVKRRDGTFVSATPVKDAVLLNIADLMQRWTNDEFISVIHKVTLPGEETKRYKARQSMVLFVHPNGDTIINGIKGVHKYPPVNAHDYLWENFKKTYSEG